MVKDNNIEIDKRPWYRRFFSKDSRNTTLEQIKKMYIDNTLSSQSALFILEMLKDTYKTDSKWCGKVDEFIRVSNL